MRNLLACSLMMAMIGSTAYAADLDLPQLSIIAGEAAEKSAASGNLLQQAPTAGSKDRSLDDFYNRNRKTKGKKTDVPESGKKEKGQAKSEPPAEDVYGEVPLPPTAKEDEFGSQVAMPEVVQKAVMSRSDVNRIICSEPVKDVIFSEEKGVISKFYGNSAYIKFNFDQVGDAAVYSKNPVELHVICGETTYTLVAVPLPVPPQVIRLGSDKVAKVKENAAMFKDSTTNKQIRELMMRAYRGDYPESFTVKKYETPIYLYRDLDVTLLRTVTVEGEGMAVKEFQVVSKVDGIELKEKFFLKRELSDNFAAVAIEPGKEKPKKGEPVRVFVVEFKAEKSPEGAAHVE
ncbi:TraK domain-containing protein [Geomonas subterranea]|uniref:TraK domain-containing protein n=1 Tax=Geomonas subterranea TaxID=2847989 RepID=UPI001CD23E5C|nr:type-F conjugative transfer system secretin TraK [Geomonas fuzhouensis]